MELARDARPYNYVQGMSCLQILSRPEQHKGRKAETFGHLKALNPVATFPFRQQAGLINLSTLNIYLEEKVNFSGRTGAFASDY